jgi:hypothetical protein
MALVFTQADLDNLKAALVSGTLRVQLGDRLVIYRSQAELINAIKLVDGQLSGINTTSTANVIQSTFAKGRVR